MMPMRICERVVVEVTILCTIQAKLQTNRWLMGNRVRLPIWANNINLGDSAQKPLIRIAHTRGGQNILPRHDSLTHSVCRSHTFELASHWKWQVLTDFKAAQVSGALIYKSERGSVSSVRLSTKCKFFSCLCANQVDTLVVGCSYLDTRWRY